MIHQRVAFCTALQYGMMLSLVTSNDLNQQNRLKLTGNLVIL